MEVGSNNSYPGGALSNFTPRRFYFDGVECCSIEGVLQSFKFKEIPVQVEVCKLVGFAAKKRGSKKNWQVSQTLWWQGKAYGRHTDDYQKLLDRLYTTVYEQCVSFRNALVATQKANLTHSIGRTNESETVLTRREFCSRLMKLRDNSSL